jgi:hypothetical protein
METRSDDFDLTAELNALRPSPRLAFTDELDARLATGFQRPDRRNANFLARTGKALRAVSPRRIALPAAGVALAAIAFATAVIATEQPANEASSGRRFSDLGQGAVRSTPGGQSKLQHSAAPPTATGNPRQGFLSAAANGSAAGVELQSNSALRPLRLATGPFASKASHRDVERSAEMVLGTDPAAVRGDVAKVFEAVHAVDGIVLNSSIRDGGEGEAGAHFDLLIPAAKVGDALASFSRIGEVRSRHEATQDITAPTIGVGERLSDSQARIDGLLAQLARADTESERSSVEAELRSERSRHAGLRARLKELSRRAHLSRISLRIETGAASMGSSGGSWGVDDALGDAGRILATAAGVAVIGLAAIGPLALIALLAWSANRAWVRNRRQRALD